MSLVQLTNPACAQHIKKLNIAIRQTEVENQLAHAFQLHTTITILIKRNVDLANRMLNLMLNRTLKVQKCKESVLSLKFTNKFSM